MGIASSELRLVLQKSGNICAFPNCRKLLTAGASPVDRPVVLGDVAHIIGVSVAGPRGASPIPLNERNRYENLILLCTQHHQLVDAQRQTYTVEWLRRIKEEHERWVEQALRGERDNALQTLPKHEDVVFSTLLPVERMPGWVYGIPCDLPSEKSVNGQLGRLRDGEMAPFILRSGMLFVFQDLNAPGNPFSSLVPGRSAERFDLAEWVDHPDHSRWLTELMNRALNKLTGRRGLMLDREHRRYFFPMIEEGHEREVQYRPLNQNTASRRVVWRRRNKRTGEPRRNWYHRAVALSFLRTGRADWVLSLRPELRVTKDGVTSIAPRKVGGQVTREKSRRFNADLLAEVNFWRDYLRDGRSKIILPFGPGQGMVISTEILTGLIDWPGIPKEHAVPFKNLTYIDDLFTWAELNRLDVPLDDDEAVEDLEDAEEPEDDDTDE